MYSLGGYSTYDVDLVCDRKVAGEVLEKLGFRKEGRFWINDELEIVVEFPDITLAGSKDRIETFEVDGFRIYVIGKEDLIVDRLNACVFWKSSEIVGGSRNYFCCTTTELTGSTSKIDANMKTQSMSFID